MAASKDVRGWLEIGTTIGVILSLVFVGMEIRQNTQAVKGATIEALAAQSIEFVTAWSTDEVMPGILGRVRDGALPEDLSADELSRVRLAYITGLRSYESRYWQFRLGILDEQAFEMLAGNAAFWRTPMFRALWSSVRIQVGEEFAEFFESRFELN